MDGLGIEALHTAGTAVQLQPFNFVPARFPDNPPIPEGVDIIRLIPKSYLSEEVSFSTHHKCLTFLVATIRFSHWAQPKLRCELGAALELSCSNAVM